jgi:hypothetical protein
MNVGDPTRKIPAFEEIYSRDTGRGEYRKQKTEFRIRGILPLKHMQDEIQTIRDCKVR